MLILQCSIWNLWQRWLIDPLFVPQAAFLLPSILRPRCRRHFLRHLTIRKETKSYKRHCYSICCFQCDCWMMTVILSVAETSQQLLVKMMLSASAGWRLLRLGNNWNDAVALSSCLLLYNYNRCCVHDGTAEEVSRKLTQPKVLYHEHIS